MSESDGLNGQWVGAYTGSSNGRIIVNIDKMESGFRGRAYLTDDDQTLPGSVVVFAIAGRDKEFSVRTDWIIFFDRASGQDIALNSMAEKYPGVRFPKYADVKGALANDVLKLSWTTEVEAVPYSCELPRSKAGKPSEIAASMSSWENYKKQVAVDLPKRYLFRGQNQPWRLRTSFHRAGRADLQRFIDGDIKALHRQLSARTKHIFNLTIGDENGAFFNLVQHHGYPTPLLDWTYSPYVGAFFAYRGITKEQVEKASSTDKARVLVFDQAQWQKDFNQLFLLILSTFHVSIAEFIAIENERMIPQQAASMITNVDDIEGYIRSKEKDTKKYLWAIDLPVKDRGRVMRELSYMGITAGSMFPGLDGACEELKERNFEI